MFVRTAQGVGGVEGDSGGFMYELVGAPTRAFMGRDRLCGRVGGRGYDQYLLCARVREIEAPAVYVVFP